MVFYFLNIVFLELCLKYAFHKSIDYQKCNEHIHNNRTNAIYSLPRVSYFYILKIAVESKDYAKTIGNKNKA